MVGGGALLFGGGNEREVVEGEAKTRSSDGLRWKDERENWGGNLNLNF